MLSFLKRRAKMVETRLYVMQRDMCGMEKYFDALPKSMPAVREPFERSRAAMDAYKWEEAIAFFQKAAEEAKGTELVALLNLMGLCHCTSGRPDYALRDYEESTSLAEKFDDKPGKAVNLGNLGNMYRAKGESDKAIECHEEALAIHREIGYRPGVASTLGNIGNAYVWAMKIAAPPAAARHKEVAGLAQKAIEYLVPALGMLLQMGIADGPEQCLWGLGECCEVLGRERFVQLCVKAGMSEEKAEGLAEARPEATEHS